MQAQQFWRNFTCSSEPNYKLSLLIIFGQICKQNSACESKSNCCEPAQLAFRVTPGDICTVKFTLYLSMELMSPIIKHYLSLKMHYYLQVNHVTWKRHLWVFTSVHDRNICLFNLLLNEPWRDSTVNVNWRDTSKSNSHHANPHLGWLIATYPFTSYSNMV